MEKDIINYYNKSRRDYSWIWKLNRYHAIHYGFYDTNHRTHGQAVNNLNAILAKIANIKNTDDVLDSGCGIGGSSIWLAENIGCKVIGISIVPKQIEEANLLAEKYKVVDNVNFFIRDYTNTGLADQSLDVVWAIESVCYSIDKSKFITEASRLLKSGGRVIIADGFLKREPISAKEKKYLFKWLDGWAVSNLEHIDKFKAHLENARFTNIKYIDITENVTPSSKRMYRVSIITYPFAKIMQFFGLRSKIEMKNAAAAYYQRLIFKSGLCSYGIFYAEKL